MRTGHEKLEDRLRALLRSQAESVPVPDASWTDVGTARGHGAQSRRAQLLALGVAAMAAALLAVALVSTGDPAERVQTGPAAQGEGQPSEPAAATATTAPAAEPGTFRAESRQVSLTADALVIDVGGKQFVTAAPVRVHGDPGDPEYTTLELTWQEHGVEMRLSLYFSADGREWWSNEIRTYDGNANGEWIIYTGDFFRSPLGTPFTGDFTVATPDPAVGRLHLANLRLDAFRKPAECATATGPFVLDPGTSPIVLEGYLSGYGAAVQLLDSATCQPVADQDRYAYDWNSRDSGVVTVGSGPMPVELPGRRASLTPGARGRTTIQVTAHDPATGALVAETDIEVVVGEVKSIPAPTTTITRGSRTPPAPSVTAQPPRP